jgi:membrane protein implicated in regulation of membrane protease activity
MLTLFWFALVLGGGLALFSVIGDLFDADGADHFHIEHDAGDSEWQLLSLRTITYFLFAFGAVGVLIHASTPDSPAAALAGALFTGAVAGVGSAAVFRYLRRTSSGGVAGDRAYEGLTARVVLPLRNGRGKIAVERAGREIELMASCYDADAAAPESWTEVVIVEVRGGTAYVSPMYELERADALLPPESEI